MNVTPSPATPPEPEEFRPADLKAGATLLLQAHDFAKSLGRELWEFAVEMSCLFATGLSHSTLRWLVCKGYMEHAVETTPPGARQRLFHPVDSLALPDGTCFVLTEEGAMMARQILGRPLPPTVTRVDQPHASAVGPSQLLVVHPHWDPELRELRCGSVLIKEFKRPAPNQELVLSAFEEEAWPRQIDDPLPGTSDQEAKQRLHDTINRLNRNQKNRLVTFRGDGSGKGVRWEWLQVVRHTAPRDPH